MPFCSLIESLFHRLSQTELSDDFFNNILNPNDPRQGPLQCLGRCNGKLIGAMKVPCAEAVFTKFQTLEYLALQRGPEPLDRPQPVLARCRFER
jgi:hypothetical protein